MRRSAFTRGRTLQTRFCWRCAISAPSSAPIDLLQQRDLWQPPPSSVAPVPDLPALTPERGSSTVSGKYARRSLCCTDQQLGEVSPPHRHLFEANVFRPPKLQHTAERRDSNGHLRRLPPFGPRAQRVTNHSLVA